VSDPADYWDTLFDVDDMSARLTIFRNLVRIPAGKDPVAM
jgi:hypothetical protein